MTKKRFFPALLLTLVLSLSLTPISAFADGVNYMQKVKVAYTHIGYKAGDTPRKTASVTEGNCTVAYEYWREIYQKVEGGTARGATGTPTWKRWHRLRRISISHSLKPVTTIPITLYLLQTVVIFSVMTRRLFPSETMNGVRRVTTQILK